MKRGLTFLLLCLMTTHTLGVSRTVSNPQTQMVSSRVTSLGITTPVINGDIGAMYANPASLGDVESMPLSISSKRIMNEFDYRLINIGYPVDLRIPVNDDRTMLQHIMFGLSYGEVVLDDIPETALDSNSVPHQIGSFSSGYRVLGLGAGTSFYDMYGFDTFSVGVNTKLIQFYTLGSKASTFGLDVGAIGTRYYDYSLIDKLHAGVVIQNVIAPALRFDESGNEGVLPFDFYAGLRADMMDERLSLYFHNGLENLSYGAEYSIDQAIHLRGSTDFTRYNLGTGIIFDRVAGGFGDREYSLRLDYNYTQNAWPMDADPNHTFSFSILGESRPKSPRILSPSEEFFITSDRLFRMSGIGPKNTTIQIFNNHTLSRTVISDRNGKWSISDFPLKEGRNFIYLKSYSLDKDTSLESYPLVVYSDTKSPELNVEVFPEGNMLTIRVDSSENLVAMEGSVGNSNLVFEMILEDIPQTNEVVNGTPIPQPTILHDDPTSWLAQIPLPKEIKGPQVPKDMMVLQLNVQDEAGNQSGVLEFPFFVGVEFPQDKYVHYKESIRFIGTTSEMVQTVEIDDNAVYIDPSNQFAIPIDLVPGKNTVRVRARTLNDQVVDYSMRILRLVTFPDLNERVRGRREIEFLATLGILTGDDDENFYPYRPVTREYVAKLMVLASGGDEDTIGEVTTDLFSDVSRNHPFARYIQAAVQSGLIFAYPDGTFKPEQALTLSETVFLLSNAGIINFQEVDEDEVRYITRNELAEFLAYSPEYELKIENLINWDKGY